MAQEESPNGVHDPRAAPPGSKGSRLFGAGGGIWVRAEGGGLRITVPVRVPQAASELEQRFPSSWQLPNFKIWLILP